MQDEPNRSPIPEVEELSDLQWARIERGLWHRMDAAPLAPEDSAHAEAAAGPMSSRARSARRWRFVALGGAMAAAAVLLLALWPGGDGGRSGLVATGADGGDRSDEPARVVTRASATTVSFADAAIEVRPNSALLMSGTAERGATIVLERGRAGFHVAPRSVRQPFVVVAGNALVRVVGTRFEVARNGEDVTVEVQEGVVDVRYLGQVHRVMAGSQWSSPAVKTTEETLLEGGGANDAGDTSDAGVADAPVASGGTSLPGDRSSSSSPAVKPKPALPKVGQPASPTPAETSALSAEFEGAAQLESAAPQQAMHRYLELSQRSDRWGRNALFAAARLALDLGDRDRAAQLARSYLRRFPSGPNAPDARALLDSLP